MRHGLCVLSPPPPVVSTQWSLQSVHNDCDLFLVLKDPEFQELWLLGFCLSSNAQLPGNSQVGPAPQLPGNNQVGGPTIKEDAWPRLSLAALILTLS